MVAVGKQRTKARIVGTICGFDVILSPIMQVTDSRELQRDRLRTSHSNSAGESVDQTGVSALVYFRKQWILHSPGSHPRRNTFTVGTTEKFSESDRMWGKHPGINFPTATSSGQ
ncbi:hypothetical protein QCA50_010656 [Cerrena zonata]|uniref:Uncharacterized protein n=1 Tax=Cerrena zonata TaxID=2478898 RepID=A0AAW0G4I7_9APHY